MLALLMLWTTLSLSSGSNVLRCPVLVKWKVLLVHSDACIVLQEGIHPPAIS